MKRELKYFLLGAFSVVGGFLIYVWTRDPSKSTQPASENRAASAPAPTASSSAPGTQEQVQKQALSPSCNAVCPDAAEPSLPDASASAPTAPDHTAQSANAEESNQ